MIKRTVEISKQAVHVTVKNRQLRIIAKDEERTERGCVPCEDIGVLLVDHAGTTYSHAALTTLLECNAAVVICGRNHLPAGILLPIGEHTEVVWRIREQLTAGKPLRKQLWKQVVQAKIRAQAGALPEESAVRKRLLSLARTVRSGDPTNIESQAARAYWPKVFDDEAFRRDPDGSGINALLNYGYAVMRAAVARAIVAAGLLPALGLHHSGRSNAFCLADDLMEPLRPLVDVRVRGLIRDGRTELDAETKPPLLELLTVPMCCADQTGPLMAALHRMVASLVRCFEGESKRLAIPESAVNAHKDDAGG